MSAESVRLRLFPLNTVLFPGATLNLHIFEPRYKQMISECLAGGAEFGVTFIRKGDEAGDPAVVPHLVGTTAEITDVRRLDQGRYFLRTVGRRRFRIDGILEREPYLLVEASFLQAAEAEPDAVGELAEIRKVFSEYLSLLVEFSGMSAEIRIPDDPVAASFLIGDVLQVGEAMKQRLLEIVGARQRLSVELSFLRRLMPQLRTLLERKREESPPPAAPSSGDPLGGEFRSHQEKFFGKHFSRN